jgi:hypothetical protein
MLIPIGLTALFLGLFIPLGFTKHTRRSTRDLFYLLFLGGGILTGAGFVHVGVILDGVVWIGVFAVLLSLFLIDVYRRDKSQYARKLPTS